jgi:undecaprenyl-phosphate alpha-N-acetylglucosaminyl 1-phosphatetransferase
MISGMPTVIIAAVLAGVLSTILIQLFRKPALEYGLVAEPGEHRQHTKATPLIGGLGIFLSFFIISVLFGRHLPVSCYVAFGLMVALGVVDDRWEIPFWIRFIVQIAASYLLVVDGLLLHDLGNLVSEERFTLGRWSVPLTIFSMVGVINAVNMIDGLDGLLGGLLVVMLSVIGVVMGPSHPYQIAVFIVAGALGGFLLFNFRFSKDIPARVFMGDAGSLFMGLFVAWLLVGNSQGPDRSFPPVVALWILAIPLFDTVGVMLRRIARGRSPFSADRLHTHHLLMESGFGVIAAVLLLVLSSALFALIGLYAWNAGVSERLLFYIFLVLFFSYLALMEMNQHDS